MITLTVDPYRHVARGEPFAPPIEPHTVRTEKCRMPATNTPFDGPALPHMLAVDDLRIPAAVRACLGNYNRPITRVAPVVSTDRIEWLLYAADHALIDVLIHPVRITGAC